MRYRDLTVRDFKSPKNVAHFPARDGQLIFAIGKRDGFFLARKKTLLVSFKSRYKYCFGVLTIMYALGGAEIDKIQHFPKTYLKQKAIIIINNG